MASDTPSRLPPRVVVALPVRNGAATLPVAVRSALSQKGIETSCIVSENWSTDTTSSVVTNLVCSDSRVHLVTPTEPCAAAENFRFAFERARSFEPEFFTWLAADDELLDGYLLRATEELTRNPAIEFVIASAEFVSADSLARLSVRSCSPRLDAADSFRRFLGYACQSRWNEIYAVYRPSTFDALSSIDDRFGFDVVLTWRLLLRGPAARLDMIGTRYSVRSDGPSARVTRVKYKLCRAREGSPPKWLGLWRDLFRVAAEAPSATIRRQARTALVIAAVHPHWLRKFAEEAFRRTVYATRRRSSDDGGEAVLNQRP